ncbi:head-tail joining protein [Comamonas sp. CMM03]|uniref:head-tail joining protein n=1 Tax=Comamonas sp. CMM03 TaxID=2854781 RepID=UPI001C4764D5|nr:head-tail joining protein [Comamonas sp. CMM03]MBV7418447.1 head-tail joining protein [Comamonas sp. CMM03]
MLQLNTAPFFNTQHFAQAAVLGGVTVQGIFDDAGAVGGVGDLGMATTQPTLLLPTSEVPASVRGMKLEVAGQLFTVEDDQPDGTGMTLLVLEVLHA